MLWERHGAGAVANDAFLLCFLMKLCVRDYALTDRLMNSLDMSRSILVGLGICTKHMCVTVVLALVFPFMPKEGLRHMIGRLDADNMHARHLRHRGS